MHEFTDKQIAEFLEKCGFKHSFAGYRYAIEIIKLCAADTNREKSLRDIYDETGRIFDVTRSGVERSLRYTIEHSNLCNIGNKEFMFSAIDSMAYGTSMALKEAN